MVKYSKSGWRAAQSPQSVTVPLSKSYGLAEALV
jgi:hypothetical protein